MSSEQINSLQHVYDKWEKRAPVQCGTAVTGPSPNEDRARRVIEEGRQKWRKKFGDAPKPTMAQRKPRSTFTNAKIPTASSIQLQNLGKFKTAPTIVADEFRTRRPFLHPACRCTDLTRRELDKPHYADLGVIDVLNVDRHLRNASPLGRLCSDFTYITHRRKYFTFTDVTREVLSCTRLRTAIQEKAEHLCAESGDKSNMAATIDRLTRGATKVLGNMKARMSNVIMVWSGWILMKFFTRLLSRIQIHSGQMQLVKAASERDIPLIYLPSHRSHLDYILITVLLWINNIRVPYIAAGENLNLPVFSYFMKRQGAFFIRRQLDRTPGQRDTVYRALLHSYMEELLIAGESMEFFVEGGRSRTGKPCQPKAGLLSVVIESCLQGTVDDVYIVPVSINYERTLEGSFSHEQMGTRKQKETFISVVKGLWDLFSSHYGTVRVNFAQPFSLKEYIHVSQEDQSVLSCSDSDSVVSVTSPNSSLCRKDSFYMGENLVDGQRAFIKNVARHVVYNTMQATSLMCTNLVAFLLLTKHRYGTTLHELSTSLVSLVYTVTNIHKHDVTFSGHPRDIVEYACRLLGPSLILTSENGLIRPNLTLPHVFDLLYYANIVTPLFIMESIVGSCALALSGLSLAVVQSESLTESVTIKREDILSSSLELCSLLKEEFLLVAPCMSLDSVICETIDQLITSELFTVQINTSYAGTSYEENMWARRFEKRHRWKMNDDDDSGEEERETQFIKINLSQPDLITRLTTYHEIIAPYAESLCLVTKHISQLKGEEIPEDTFMKELHSDAVMRCDNGLAMYVEHAGLETLRNSVRILESLHYAHSYYAGTLRMIGPFDSHDSPQRLRKLQSFLMTLFV